MLFREPPGSFFVELNIAQVSTMIGAFLSATRALNVGCTHTSGGKTMENTEVKTQEQTGTEEKTFTQAELNAIVQSRVGELTDKYKNYEELKEKAQKFDALEEESKTELQKATEKADALEKELTSLKAANKVREIHEEVAKATGVPAHLLTGETKEACEAQAKAIMSFAKPEAFPVVPDGGEVRNTGHTGSAREQFADWANETFLSGGK